MADERKKIRDGWRCPRCWTIYAPWVAQCDKCCPLKLGLLPNEIGCPACGKNPCRGENTACGSNR